MAAPTVQGWFHELATRYVEAQVLFHLNQVGVWGALAERGPATAPALAAALGLDSRLLAVLLDYVASVDGLLEQDGAGRYALAPFGQAVLARFGRQDVSGQTVYNFFDVRVGAYGPVWAALGDLLTGAKVYGQNLHRDGAFAAEATYTITPRMAPTVARLAEQLGLDRLVEIGVPPGMLAHLAPSLPGVALVGLDVDATALARAAERAAANGVTGIQWVQGDVFDAPAWADQVPASPAGGFVTIHMHELSSRGLDATVAMLRGLGERFPGWRLIALEQDRLPREARAELSPDLWLYSQSNVLIHHLIRNANILTREAWVALYERAGCAVLAVEPLGYLGYNAYVVSLSPRAPALRDVTDQAALPVSLLDALKDPAICAEKLSALRGCDGVEDALARIVLVFCQGLHLAAQPDALLGALEAVPRDLRGFAYEGAAAGLAIAGFGSPEGQVALAEFAAGPGAAHGPLVAIGAGVNHLFRRQKDAVLAALDPRWRWFAVDGFGYREAFLYRKRALLDQCVPDDLTGYAARAFDQGLGRGLWFVCGGDPVRLWRQIGRFPAARQADLWSGVGFAATYTGVAGPDALATLARLHARPHLALGAAIGALARRDGGFSAAGNEAAVRGLTGLSLADAAALAEACWAGLGPDEPGQPAYAKWRQALAARLAATTTG